MELPPLFRSGCCDNQNKNNSRIAEKRKHPKCLQLSLEQRKKFPFRFEFCFHFGVYFC